VAHLILNRPALNVLDIASLCQLNQALRESDQPAVRVVLISSALPRAFSAGVEVGDHVAERLDRMLSEVRENARLLLGLRPVTIASIHGSTLGGGAEIALLCDLIIAADDTVLSFPEIGLAAFPPIAASFLLERCPSATAMQLLLGEPMDAAQLERAGMVNQVVARSQLEARAQQLAAGVAARSGVALRGLISATRGQRAPDMLRRLDTAIATYKATIGPSRDAVEGIRAFFEKRHAAWSHR
jgi:enoyl-CoA hydratase/carnithine racemase